MFHRTTSLPAALTVLLLLAGTTRAQPENAGAKLVTIEVTILEITGVLQVQDPQNIEQEKLQQAIQTARQAGLLEHLSRVRLSSMTGREARVQWGSTTSILAGRTVSGFGRGTSGNPTPRMVNSYRDETTGTLVTATSSIAAEDRVVVALNIEQTRMVQLDDDDNEGGDDGDSEEAADDDDLLTPKRKTLTLQTTTILPAGRTVLVSGGQELEGDDEGLQTYVLVRATIHD